MSSSANIWIGFQPSTLANKAGYPPIPEIVSAVGAGSALNVEIKYHLSPRGVSSGASQVALARLQELSTENHLLR